MSKIGLIFLFILLAVGGYGQLDHIAGQPDHFVLIRADNNQPFNVHIGEQTLNSTAQGHLILFQLKDSVYHITIGFPKKAYPDEDFYMVIDKNDLAFQLKEQEGKGWVLVNMQTQELEMPVRTDTVERKTRLEGIKKDDAFSRLMAAVVSDTAVMYNSYVAEAAHRDSAAVHKDSAAAHKDTIAHKDSATAVRPDSSARKPDSSVRKPDSSVRKPDSSVRKPDSSMRRPDSPVLKPGSPNPQAIRPDTFGRKPDSALVSITLVDIPRVQPEPPLPPPPLKPSARSSVPSPARSSVTSPARTAKTGLIQKISEQRTATILRLAYTDRAKGHKTDTIDVIIPIDTLPAAAPPIAPAPSPADSMKGRPPVHAARQAKNKPVVINSDCRNYASDDDADKLKGRLLAILGEDARIAAAKKVFKLKCFSTNQLKGISEIFSGEATKYKFLETAYPFVSDDGFRELVSLFTDPVYIAKFKTLTGAGGQ